MADMFVRRLVFGTLLAAALLAAAGSLALADPPDGNPNKQHHHHGTPAPRSEELRARPEARPEAPGPHSHAVVAGSVIGVNYGVGSVLVATPQGVVPVAVTPSTSIIRGATYGSFSNLQRGAHVTIDVTDVGGQLIAQIIHIY